MKFGQVLKLLAKNEGFRIAVGPNLEDFFPEMDEQPIADENTAWEIAKKFYVATDKVCTVEVVTANLKKLINSSERIIYSNVKNTD